MRPNVVFFLLAVFFVSCHMEQQRFGGTPVLVKTIPQDTLVDAPCVNPETISFLDINVEELCVREKEAGKKESLKKIFAAHKLDKYQYEQFLEESKAFYDFTTIKPRQKYFTISKESDSASVLQYLVFKLSDYEYVITNCTDTSWVSNISDEELARKKKRSRKFKQVFYHPLQVSFYEKNIDTTKVYFAAVIRKSVYKTFKEQHVDVKLIENLNTALNGKFNLNRMRDGDTLQFIYDQLSINGQFLQHGHLQAIAIKSRKKTIYAVDYFLKDDSSYQYVDDNGKYLKTSFLKSPLQKGGRIASKFSLNRMHPVLQVEKAHLGTDFAAPQGTPIIATASGVITAAQFSQNNGNYVKIRHDRKFETQYLHMSRFARGIRNGVRVQQGQVIGYVGSTGLATGPHVCYRFWKNGCQVDPLREKLNVVKQIPKEMVSDYQRHFEAVKRKLESIVIS
jgi:murein DD-endopeptidase MepM/ murein hydrolase activator NlpD